jgi:hypothetical protein
MNDLLADEQFHCQEFRRHLAPDHTYKNDRQILESIRSILDANMQIPSYDESWLIELIRRKSGVLVWQQLLLKMVTEAYPQPSPTSASQEKP